MQDRPDARELVEAVAIFLQRELSPIVSDPRLRFRALVAANVLSIVARELQAGTESLRAEWSGLVQLLGKADLQAPPTDQALREELLALNRELAARIRAGDMDASSTFEAALDHADVVVVDKLRIANPRYLERVAGDKP